ncbi:MAG: NAD(P)-dependent oxidoreductase [Chitinophagales bacterium]|nr:alanine dehydrogenase [Bacteroidota bacterium]MCB9043889.1 alanine dehydrogenase [Chitinophagales bacterium]
MQKLSFGIIREGKTPPDTRTPLTPKQISFLQQKYPQFSFVVQPSPNRCFSDEAYLAEGILVSENLEDCTILMGVKEVPVAQLIPEKTYLFFSHTIKKQLQNKKLLQAILQQKIRLIDYECLRDTQTGSRLIGFGYYAGIVGAHNGLQVWGKRTHTFDLPAAYNCKDFAAIKDIYDKTKFSPCRIVLTGNGKVPRGAKATLDVANIPEVSPTQFLADNCPELCYTVLHYSDMYCHRSTHHYEGKSDFYTNPENYYCRFAPFTQVADLFINGIFWKEGIPVFFTKNEMRRPDFNIKVIADVTCDIAPAASIPATLRETIIGDPVFGYDPFWEKETAPYQKNSIDMMTIDNLPNELPRDASQGFGEMLIEKIIPEFLPDDSAILADATIANDGVLTKKFAYLGDYVE